MNDLDASVLIMPQTSHTKTVYMMRHKSLRTRYHPKNRAQETITPGNEITQLQQETVLHLESLNAPKLRTIMQISEAWKTPQPIQLGITSLDFKSRSIKP
jgi:hypothetical protein